MSTAIERAEAWLDPKVITNPLGRDDLTELVELAKIGERARETPCIPPSDYGQYYTNDWNECLLHILGGHTTPETETKENTMTVHTNVDELRVLLTALAKDVEKVNRDNAWYEEDRRFGEDIALLHSEVSEMLEAYRDGMLDTTFRESDGKPEGIPSEAADILIRLLDTCQRYNIDLAGETITKLKYNATRGHRHGGKAL